MWKSGTGKSTLVKFMMGAIRAPLKSIYHKREDMARYSDYEIQMFRRKVWIVFQDYQLVEDFTVKENIEYPLRLYEVGDSIVDRKFLTIRNRLWLQDIQNTKVKFLSGGEKQKVAIARALIHDPEFVIADEPTWNLDWEHTQQIADLLIETNRLGNTVFLITHDIHLLEYLKYKHSQEIKIRSM